MPVDLAALAAPGHTAVLTMEMQRGVVGDLAMMRELAEEVAARGTIPAIESLLGGCRRAGVRVVHCLAGFRPDRQGTATNAPLLNALLRNPDHLVLGTPAVELVPTLGPEPSDVSFMRLHGLTPFIGTGLDQHLRNLGVTTIVTTGVSVNLGVLGMVMGAVDLGYRVVLPIDAVAGVPRAYADDLIANTLSLLATRTTVDALLEVWA